MISKGLCEYRVWPIFSAGREFTQPFGEKCALQSSLFLLTWQILHQRPELQQSVNVIFKGPVGNSRYCRVRLGASQFLLSDSLPGHSLDHVGAGDEEVGGVLHHKCEISQSRRVDGASGTGTFGRGAIEMEG